MTGLQAVLLTIALATITSLLVLAAPLIIDYRQAMSKTPAPPPMNTRLVEFEAAAMARASGVQRRKIKNGDVALLAELVEEIKAERIPNYRELQKQREQLQEALNRDVWQAGFCKGLPRSFGGPAMYEGALRAGDSRLRQIEQIDRQLNP